MGFSIVGVDHKTSPVSIREPLALSSGAASTALDALVSQPSIDEAVLVSTCARTELYLWSQDSSEEEACGVALNFLLALNLEAATHIVSRRGTDAVEHTFRVASGLESQVIGESEIAGQLRAATQQARSRGTIGPRLDSLFRAAAGCSRRLRQETDLGSVDTSVAIAAAAIARQHLSISQSTILIVGSGKIARMLAAEFKPARRLAMATRSPLPPEIRSLDVETIPLEVAIEQLADFDLVACATRSDEPILSKAQIAQAAPLLVFDLALPRNVDPQTRNVEGIVLYDVDAVKPPAEQGDQQPAGLVDSIVATEVRDFMGRESVREVAPIIAALRAHVDQVREQELDRVRVRLENMEPAQRAVIETLTTRLIDRMFHHLVLRLRLAALTDPELVKAAEFFFAHGDDALFPSDAVPGGADDEPAALEKVTP